MNIETKETEMLGVNILFPHPKNPRKNLGDLTELTESIKANGILQNLTVIPREEGGYTVLIGHRRLAAAKEAGLIACPCYVMKPVPDEKTQVLIMLSENMQRNDLTLIEEADGLQYAFDLGSSVKDLSEKTGLSDQTIRNRLAITKLDRQIIENTSFQISITDYIELAKIPDVDVRNKILKKSSSSENLKWNIRMELESIEIRAKMQAIIDKLTELGFQKQPELKGKMYTTLERFWRETTLDYVEERAKKIDATDPMIYLNVESWQISICKAQTDEEFDEAKEEERKRREKEEKARADLEEIKKTIRTFLYFALTGSGKIAVRDKDEKDELTALRALRKEILKGDLDMASAKDVIQICENKSYYVQPSEKEFAKYKDDIDKMSVALHRLFSKYERIRDYSTYTTHYKKEYREMVSELKKHGFELPADLAAAIK